MTWTKPHRGRELPISHYSRALGRIRHINFEKRYPRLSVVLGGGIFIKEKIREISDTLQRKNVENIPILKVNLKQAFAAITCFSQENNLHTDTPSQKMMRDFVKNPGNDEESDVDEHAMLRIISHCLFILSINLYVLESEKNVS